MGLTSAELSKKLEEISKVLETKYAETMHLGVFNGISGISLFFFYYSKYRDVNTYSKVGTEILELTIERINAGYQTPTYCSGIAGAGWIMEHLHEEGFVELDNDELLSGLDEYLYKTMKSDLEKGFYDILHGALGYGFYFLKRYKNTNSAEFKERYQGYLNTLVSGLDSLAEEDANGLKWRSVLNKETGKVGYNLSLSHGMSSIVNFLARLCQFDEFKATALPLLRGAISYLLSKEKDHATSTLFPSTISIPETAPDDGRVSWCYGDLGLGFSLLQASEIMENEQLATKALRVLKHATFSKTVEECKMLDAAPCHGAFGLSQIYLSLFQKTGMSEFEEAATHWIDEGLKLAVHSDGYAGYKQYSHREGWTPETGLLEGIAGIGLAIISYLADFETRWDECLFIR